MFYAIYISILKPILSYLKYLVKILKLKLTNPTLKLVGRIDIKNYNLGIYNYFSKDVTFYNSSIGDFSYIGSNSKINNVKIGKFTCIGPNVIIGLGSHPTDFISIHPIFYSISAQNGKTFSDKNYYEEYNTTEIGNDVWIGANVIIPGGIKVGDGAIIATGAVVTKDIPPYAVVGGIPAKIIKYRFDNSSIEKLEKMKWWSFDYEVLKKHYKLMHNISNLEKLEKTK